jgi:hypothetical protein
MISIAIAIAESRFRIRILLLASATTFTANYSRSECEQTNECGGLHGEDKRQAKDAKTNVVGVEPTVQYSDTVTELRETRS